MTSSLINFFFLSYLPTLLHSPGVPLNKKLIWHGLILILLWAFILSIVDLPPPSVVEDGGKTVVGAAVVFGGDIVSKIAIYNQCNLYISCHACVYAYTLRHSHTHAHTHTRHNNSMNGMYILIALYLITINSVGDIGAGNEHYT